jgi:hypothetical protein
MMEKEIGMKSMRRAENPGRHGGGCEESRQDLFHKRESNGCHLYRKPGNCGTPQIRAGETMKFTIYDLRFTICAVTSFAAGMISDGAIARAANQPVATEAIPDRPEKLSFPKLTTSRLHRKSTESN